MKTIGRTFLTIALAASFSLHAGAQDFVNVVPQGLSGPGWLSATPDGGLLAVFYFGPGQRTLVKLDEQGDVLWSKQIQHAEFWEDASGDTWVTRYVNSSSTEFEFELANLDDEGVVHGTQRLRVVDDQFNMGGVATVKLTSNAANELFILQDLSDQYMLTKIDGEGTVLWSRISNSAAFLLVEPALLATSDGGVVIAAPENGSQYGMYLIRYDANGELDWSLRARPSTPNVYMYDDPRAFRTSDDGVVIYNHGYTATEQWIFASRFSPGGEHLWSRAYRRPTNDPFIQYIGFEHPDGRLQIGAHDALTLTSTGAVIGTTSYRIPMEADGFPDLFHSYSLSLTRSGDLLFRGVRTWTLDPVLGTTDHLRMFGRLPLDLGSSCFWNEVTAVPYEEYTSSQPLVALAYPSYLQNISWNSFTSEPVTWEAFEDVDFVELGDGCELPEIVEQTTQVEDAAVPNAFTLRPSLQHAGEAVLLDTEAPLTVEVFDMSGRVVLRSSATHAGTHILSTGILPAGMYMVHGRTLNGYPVGMQRLVLN